MGAAKRPPSSSIHPNLVAYLQLNIKKNKKIQCITLAVDGKKGGETSHLVVSPVNVIFDS